MQDILLAQRPKEAILLERLLYMSAMDSAAFTQTIAAAASGHAYAFRGGTQLIEALRIFDLEQLVAVAQSMQGPKGTLEPLKFDAAVSNCIDLGLITKLHIRQTEQLVFQNGIISMYCKPNVIDNVICGRYYHLDKYQQSIVPIIVKLRSGDEATGTGFFYARKPRATSVWLITNRHVAVENVSAILSMGLFTRTLGTAIVEHPYLDICAVQVEAPMELPGLFFEKELILDEVISVGFPSVAQSLRPAMLCHKGEVNGRIAGYAEKGDELIVVSCHLAPGNSGGPLLNSAGRVLGVVCQSKIGKSLADVEGVATVHHVAVPGDTMDKFVSMACV